MEELKRFNIVENGEDIEYNVLASFNLEGRDDSYIIYSDYSVNENKKMNIKVSKYQMKEGEIELSPITTDEEKEAIQPVLEEIEERFIHKN